MTTNNDMLRSARPVIRVAGQDQAALALGLLELSVLEGSDGLYRCEATFGNWGDRNGAIDFLYFDRSLLDFGKDFVVLFDDKTLFEGRIVALEGEFPDGAPPRLTVLADDRLQDLRMTRRTRSFENKSDADVLRTIADDHGLSAQIDLNGPTHAALAQVNQSDLAFARERARAAGGELWVEGKTFSVKSRSARASTSAPKLTHGSNLRSFTASADLAHQRTKVAVTGWDVDGKRAVKHETTDSVLSSEVGSGDSGPSILQSAFGARADAVVHTCARDASEAEATANAYFQGIARRFVVGNGMAEGNADLRVGRKVELSGVGPLFNGEYVLAQTRHLFSGSTGYRTEFTVERPALGRS